MMTNEELAQKMLNDIQYIKDKAELFQKKLVDFKLDENQLKEIQSVLNYFRTADFNFIQNINNQEGLLNLENIFSPYKISIEAFLTTATKQRLENFIIHNTKVYEYMGNILNAMKEQFTPFNQEDETDERIQLKSKILEDISFLNTNSEKIQILAREYFNQETGLYDIDRIFYFIRSVTNSYLDKCSSLQLQRFYTLSNFRFSAVAFLQNRNSTNIRNLFIDAIKTTIKFIDELQSIDFSIDPIIINKQDNVQDNYIAQEIKNIKKSINDLESSDTQIKITRMLTQTKALFDEAKDSKQLVNDEIQKLISAKERQIAYTLSEQFSDKCDRLKKEVNQNLIALTVSLVLFLAWNTLLFLGFYSHWFNIEYWQFIVFKITLNIPFALYLGITFNEYSKSKKLYEEYEHKRIMASTLVNNLERLKNELHADEKDLLELIKTPFEKIFDNPVHSIYGDKSGDKNIGLDQLEKITSIIKKIDSK